MRSTEEFGDGNHEEEYFDKYYDIDVNELRALFVDISQGKDAFTQAKANEIFNIGIELGMCIREIKGDLTCLGGS